MTAEGGGTLSSEDTSRHLSTYLSACLATRLSASPSVLYLFICQSISLSFHLSPVSVCVCVSELPTAFAHPPASPGNPNLLAASAACLLLPAAPKTTPGPRNSQLPLTRRFRESSNLVAKLGSQAALVIRHPSHAGSALLYSLNKCFLSTCHMPSTAIGSCY